MTGVGFKGFRFCTLHLGSQDPRRYRHSPTASVPPLSQHFACWVNGRFDCLVRWGLLFRVGGVGYGRGRIVSVQAAVTLLHLLALRQIKFFCSGGVRGVGGLAACDTLRMEGRVSRMDSGWICYCMLS